MIFNWFLTIFVSLIMLRIIVNNYDDKKKTFIDCLLVFYTYIYI